MKSVVVLIGLALAGAIVLGVALSDSELLNPNKGSAEAEKIRAETAAFVTQNNYEQQRREIELKAAEQQAAIDARFREAQHAKELELMERNSQLKARLIELAVVGGLVVIAVLSGAGAFYILCASFTLLRQPQQLAPGIRQEKGWVIPFPGLLQRARVLANTPATALALLVLGAVVLTASVSLL